MGRSRLWGRGVWSQSRLSSYADGIAAGVDAFVHTTRYSLGLASPEMIRGVAEEPFSNDLDSPKWQCYKWLSRLSPFDERLADYAKLLASGSASLIPTADLLVLDRDPRQAVENLESIHTLILAGEILDRPALLTGTGRFAKP